MGGPEIGASITVPLTRGRAALIDAADREVVADRQWCAVLRNGGWYGFNGRFGYLHRAIMKPPRGVLVDHVNGNGLDCRRLNMRLASAAQSQANRGKQRNGVTSAYKGVYRNPGCGWVAQLQYRRRRYAIKCPSESQAALVYDILAKALYGHYARVNGIPNAALQGGLSDRFPRLLSRILEEIHPGLIVLCGWCQPAWGLTTGLTGNISHGICPRHLEELKAEIAARRATAK
jgi:hypothetical protein